MATLKEITYEIVDNLGKTGDYMFVKRIENLIIGMQATVLRQEYSKTRRFPVGSEYTLRLDTKMVTEGDPCHDGEDDCKIVRSVEKIPKPLRVKRNAPFNFIGTMNSEVSFSAIAPEEWRYINKGTRFVYKNSYYSYINDYVYLYNTQKGKINLRYVPQDPRELIELNECEGVSCDEPEVIIPEDIKSVIRRMVYEEMGQQQPENDEITISKEDGNR